MWVSPWSYVDAATVLREGTALAAVALVLAGIAIWAVERRDLGT